jgi:hypothetical protein
MAIETLGSLGMAAFNPFWCICFMTGVRAAGSSVLWVDSSLLLQKFSAPEMLGRVVAVDYSLANLTEALATLLCGILEDRAHLSPKYAYFVFAINRICCGCCMDVLSLLWVRSQKAPTVQSTRR